nr:homeodomain-like protein [Tanacetum cinerariifolium]
MPASDITVPASDTETVISPKVEATGVVSPAGVPDKTVHYDSEPARPSHKRCSVIPEAMAPDALVKRRRVDAHCWNFVIDKIDNWRHQEGEPRYDMEEGPLAQIHPITDKPIHRTIPLLVARLVHLDRQIEKNHIHQRKVSVARVETSEQEIEALRARAASVEANVAILRDVLWIAGDRITDLEFQAEDIKIGVYGPIQSPPRVGNEYQIKLPSMITGSDYFDYMKNPIDTLEDEESNGVLPTNFLIALDIPIVWIYPKPQNLKSDLGNMKNENVLSLVPGLFFQ